jgi:hypothetical protein
MQRGFVAVESATGQRVIGMVCPIIKHYFGQRRGFAGNSDFDESRMRKGSVAATGFEPVTHGL